MTFPPAPGPSDNHPWDVSVVIPAYRGRKTIFECIASVVAASVGLRCEIIVCESSQDGTVEQIQSEYPSVRIIESPLRVSAGQARNIGARAARGKYLFFVDCDCVVPTNWFQAFIEELQDQRLGAVGGSVGFRNWNNWSGSAIYFLEFLYHFPSQKPTTLNSRFLLSCNLACRKTVFESFKFYDQTLGEDVMFCHALQEAGLDIAYKPQIQVLHWNREGWGEFFQHNQRMGKSAASIQKICGDRKHRWITKFPCLIFLSPLVILPKIAMGLVGQSRYLCRFLWVSPMCLLGNWYWALAYYREVKKQHSVLS
jgi:glycosyltransferase involved in cell wall biosynthesis